MTPIWGSGDLRTPFWDPPQISDPVQYGDRTPNGAIWTPFEDHWHPFGPLFHQYAI